MARNRKNQAPEIRFGPVLKVVLWCALIGGSAIGYVWEKGQIDRLGKQISEREIRLKQLRKDNELLADQIAYLHSPVLLDRRAKELNLGLTPEQPLQVVRLVEAPAPPLPAGASAAKPAGLRPIAQRPVVGRTP